MYIRSISPIRVRPHILSKRVTTVPPPYQSPSWTIHGSSRSPRSTNPVLPLSQNRRFGYTHIRGPVSRHALESRAVHTHREQGIRPLPFQEKSCVDTRRLKGLRLMILAQKGIPVPPGIFVDPDLFSASQALLKPFYSEACKQLLPESDDGELMYRTNDDDLGGYAGYTPSKRFKTMADLSDLLQQTRALSQQDVYQRKDLIHPYLGYCGLEEVVHIGTVGAPFSEPIDGFVQAFKKTTHSGVITVGPNRIAVSYFNGNHGPSRSEKPVGKHILDFQGKLLEGEPLNDAMRDRIVDSVTRSIAILDDYELGFPEWVFEFCGNLLEDNPDQFWILQARPLYFTVQSEQPPNRNLYPEIWRFGSKGFPIQGQVFCIQKPADIQDIKPHHIICLPLELVLEIEGAWPTVPRAIFIDEGASSQHTGIRVKENNTLVAKPRFYKELVHGDTIALHIDKDGLLGYTLDPAIETCSEHPAVPDDTNYKQIRRLNFEARVAQCQDQLGGVVPHPDRESDVITDHYYVTTINGVFISFFSFDKQTPHKEYLQMDNAALLDSLVSDQSKIVGIYKGVILVSEKEGTHNWMRYRFSGFLETQPEHITNRIPSYKLPHGGMYKNVTTKLLEEKELCRAFTFAHHPNEPIILRPVLRITNTWSGMMRSLHEDTRMLTQDVLLTLKQVFGDFRRVVLEFQELDRLQLLRAIQDQVAKGVFDEEDMYLLSGIVPLTYRDQMIVLSTESFQQCLELQGDKSTDRVPFLKNVMMYLSRHQIPLREIDEETQKSLHRLYPHLSIHTGKVWMTDEVSLVLKGYEPQAT